jgi:hypothetical protein
METWSQTRYAQHSIFTANIEGWGRSNANGQTIDKWIQRLKSLIDCDCTLNIIDFITADHIRCLPTVISESQYSYLILDAEGLSLCYQDAEWISTQLHYPADRVLIWSDTPGPPGDIACYGNSLGAFCYEQSAYAAIPSMVLSKHFVMLARVPRRHRVQAAVDILERGLDTLGTISCGSGFYDRTAWQRAMDSVPPHWRERFPLLIDGMRETSDPAVHINSVQDAKITSAFCHVICETNWEDPSVGFPHRQSVIQLTEKSAKPFLLMQPFIMNSSQHTVQQIRQLGFDCFDDLIDHAYDSEENPLRRVQMVVEQISMICKRDLKEHAAWRGQNIQRLQRNRALYFDICSSIDSINQQRFLQAYRILRG